MEEPADPAIPSQRVRLPEKIRACLFDLDGVLTSTAELHAQAWKACFDGYLARHAAATGEVFRPFDLVRDYDDYVDGKPRLEGAADFLRSRGIEAPLGDPADPADTESVYGITNAKNALVERLIADHGVRPYAGSVRFVEAVRAAGLKAAVVSSSANAKAVLAAAGLDASFEVVVDGNDIAGRHLAGKPAPDAFLAAAADLGVAPEKAAVFEDSLAGVAAGRAGGFALVVGVDRAGQASALRDAGADVVVADLADLLEPSPARNT